MRGYDAVAPNFSASFDLLTGKFLDDGIPPERLHPKRVVLSHGRRYSAAYARLQQAQKRLELVVQHNEGGANKDLNRFTEELLALCEKWDR